ncbi:MAG: sodium:solute symporter family protein [Lentisphaeria bacterium]|nr:sodium:solute symporter family protein [Lentisphaeria bacterium]
MFATNFTWLDWLIVIVYLVGTGAVGVWVNRYIHSVDDYMVGGRASGTFLNTASFIGTGLGLVTIMYASMDGFNRGFACLILPLIGVCGALFVGSTGFVIKRLRTLKLTTITEFFEVRFDRRCRIAAGLICAVAGILNMGLFPKMGATYITYATGLASQFENPVLIVNLVTSALIVLVLVYTVMGGMVSVIVTDYMQFIVLGIGLVVAVCFVLTLPGLGWNDLCATLLEHKGEAAFNPMHGEGYGWLFVAWMFFQVGIIGAVGWAPEASRALTAKDAETSRKTFLLAMPGQFARWALPAILAIAAFAFIVRDPALMGHFFPDGVAEGSKFAGQALPLFLGKVVPTGLLGIISAGLLAAFMSTHDSYFLCWSSVIVRDVIGPTRKQAMTDRDQIKWTRICIVGIGMFLLIWGVWYELPESVWSYMAITGAVYFCGAGVALIGGVYWKKASSTGAFVCIIAGLISLIGLDPILKPIQELLPWVTAPIVSLFNYGVCITLFVVCSLVFPDPKKAPEGESEEA